MFLSDKEYDGSRMLVRQGAPSFVEWLRLIEIRRQMLLAHLRDMPLQKIGEFKPVQFDRSSYWTLFRYGVEDEGDASLETRVIFPRGEGFYRNNTTTHVDFIFDPPGSAPAAGATEWVWALDRDGRFLIVEILLDFNRHRRMLREESRGSRDILVKKIRILKCPVPEMAPLCKTTLPVIWTELGRAIVDWHSHRESLLADAARLKGMVEREESLLRIIGSR